MTIPEMIVGVRPVPQGYEFHLSLASLPASALCGAQVAPTQIPPNFYGIDSAIEGRWCQSCETLRRAAARAVDPPTAVVPGDAPCL